jgi:hypothetical protein
MPKTSDGGAGNAGAPFNMPPSIEDLTTEQLGELRAAAQTEFDSIYDADGGPQAASLPRAGELADHMDAITARQTAINEQAAQDAAAFEALRNRVAPPAEPESEVIEGEVVPDVDPAAAAPNPALVTASGARPTGGTTTAPRELGGLAGAKRSLNPSLSGARSVAPAVKVERELAITASVGIPGSLEAGGALTSRNQVVDLMHKTAKRLPDQRGMGMGKRHHTDTYGGVQVASIANNWGDAPTVDDDTNSDIIEAYLQSLTDKRRPAAFESLVAGGGWCAPSETRYDFFNVACEGGMVDLPTFGVTRGGVRFPVSPSFADTFSPAIAPYGAAFSSATVPWLWTETDDIATVTGSPNKPCIRVPCSTMTDVRLECYGICLTAGNLADNAWPEATRNFLRLLMSAHYHASNARYLAQMTALATTSFVATGSSAGVAAPLLGAAELHSWDYRTKYGMCNDDVLEYVVPAWSLGEVRADLSRRMGVSDMMAIANAQVAAWFDVRNIRAQFVSDYQVRSAGLPGVAGGMVAWPGTVTGLMYSAGTVARGNGMTLDLGVVRDSTLNAENDFTAAWMEECHLIAKFGHEIRQITTTTCADGSTGAADITTCQV